MGNYWDPQVVGNYPAYAPSGSGKTYASGSTAFNNAASNVYNIRAAMNKAADGTGACHIAFVQDSLGIGFDGTVGDANGGYNLGFAFPTVFRDYLNTLGYPLGGPGTMCTATGPAALAANYGYTYTGGVAPFQFYLFTSTGGTITWTSPKPCTSIDINTSNQNSNWSYTVDGGAANNVVPTGAATNRKDTITGLANAVHTIVITCGATHVLTSIAGYSSTGVHVHNLAFGGSTLAWTAGGPNINWGDTSTPLNLAGVRTFSLPGGAAAMNGVFLMLGGNDIGVRNLTPQTVANAIEPFIANNFPGVAAGTTDVMLGFAYHIPPSTPSSDATWAQYGNLIYQIAARRNWRVFDWNDRLGGVGQAVTNGLIGADNIHPKWGVSFNYGRSLAQNLVL